MVSLRREGGGEEEEEGGREDKGRCDMMDTYTQNNGALCGLRTRAGPGASTVDPQNREAKRLPTECVRRPGCLPRWG